MLDVGVLAVRPLQLNARVQGGLLPSPFVAPVPVLVKQGVAVAARVLQGAAAPPRGQAFPTNHRAFPGKRSQRQVAINVDDRVLPSYPSVVAARLA